MQINVATTLELGQDTHISRNEDTDEAAHKNSRASSPLLKRPSALRSGTVVKPLRRPIFLTVRPTEATAPGNCSPSVPAICCYRRPRIIKMTPVAPAFVSHRPSLVQR